MCLSLEGLKAIKRIRGAYKALDKIINGDTETSRHAHYDGDSRVVVCIFHIGRARLRNNLQ